MFSELEKKVVEHQLEEIPRVFTKNKQAMAYFGLFKMILPQIFENNAEPKDWIDLAFEIDVVVNQSMAENSLNPQNIKNDIAQKLLPILFKKCKEVGAEIGQAKQIIDEIVAIANIRLNKG